MTYQDRLNDIKEAAKNTSSFAYSPYVQSLYFKLLVAVEKKDKIQTKKLINRMGF